MRLPRVHLFEWEDQPWLPSVFRDFITDQLRFSHAEAMRSPINSAIAQRLKKLLERTGSERVVDLCSGAGGPVVQIGRLLHDELKSPADILLTDLYPNAAAFARITSETGGRIKVRLEPTSALDVPIELTGVRTIFTAFHHFKPEHARLILADAIRKRAPIAVFEPLERTVRMVLLVGVMSFLRGFTHTHRIGALTPSRFLLTYLIPIAPAMFAWDGMISALRSYTAEELRDLAASVDQGAYEWESGRFEVGGPFGKMPTTYLLGAPRV
jgi:hypothetical protein